MELTMITPLATGFFNKVLGDAGNLSSEAG